MKAKIYILIIILAGTFSPSLMGLAAHAQSKTQPQTNVQFGKALDFAAYMNGQDLHLDFSETFSAGFTVELYNITGAKIADWKVEKTNEKQIEVSVNQPLRKGLYIVKISSGQQILAKKLQI